MSSSAVPTVVFPPAVEREAVERREQLTRAVRAGILLPDEASRANIKMMAELFTVENARPADGERNIAAQCSYCREVVIAKADVIEYRHRCNPNVVQFMHVNPVDLA